MLSFHLPNVFMFLGRGKLSFSLTFAFLVWALQFEKFSSSFDSIPYDFSFIFFQFTQNKILWVLSSKRFFVRVCKFVKINCKPISFRDFTPIDRMFLDMLWQLDFDVSFFFFLSHFDVSCWAEPRLVVDLANSYRACCRKCNRLYNKLI